MKGFQFLKLSIRFILLPMLAFLLLPVRTSLVGAPNLKVAHIQTISAERALIPVRAARCANGSLAQGCSSLGGCLSDADCTCGGSCLRSTGECINTYGCSPIIIGLGPRPNIDLTSANAGVWFDIQGIGIRYRVAWTQPGEQAAFLVLDRDHNGRIEDGSELFGNHTPLPNDGTAPNGFEALAAYDRTANGGNGDGVIDALDSIWPELQLWIDLNHNGLSEPGELHGLGEYGLTRISLNYVRINRQDEYGNLFRFKARCQLAGKVRFGYDVYFTSRPGASIPSGHN